MLAVELDAGLGFDGLDDLVRGDRAEELALAARPGVMVMTAGTRVLAISSAAARSAASLRSRERRMARPGPATPAVTP